MNKILGGALALLALVLALPSSFVEAQINTRVANVTNLIANTATSYLTIRLSDGTNFLTPTVDGTYDAAAAATGPQILGECDDSATDAVDEGDAARLRVDCTTKALRTAPMASATGGATGVNMLSDASDNEDETAICTAECTVYNIIAFNHTASSAFLRCEMDTAGNTTPGSETASSGEPDLEIPASTTGAGFALSFPVGVTYTTALTCWIVSDEASSGTTDVAANDVRVLFVRKQ